MANRFHMGTNFTWINSNGLISYLVEQICLSLLGASPAKCVIDVRGFFEGQQRLANQVRFA